MHEARHRGAPRVPRGAPSAGGCGGPFRGPLHKARHRGAPRVSRGATNVGGCGGPFRGPPPSMTGGALALVLAAAVLHAGWNALAKRGTDPLAFLALCSCVAAPLLLPLAAPMLWHEGLPTRALPFVLGTIALHVVYFVALGRAYSTGAYSIVYPIARGLGVALVPVGAYVLLDERLSPIGIVGIAFVVAGVLTLHQVGHRHAIATGAPLGAATLWALMTGLSVASYSLLDKAGVAPLHPVPYMLLMEAGCGVLLFPATPLKPPPAKRPEGAEYLRTNPAGGGLDG